MRLLLDEMYPRRLAEELRAGGHDVVAVVELPDLVGRDDIEVADRALRDGRVLVTENVADFAPLAPEQHAGLVLVNARRWPRTPSGLPRLSNALRARLDQRIGRQPGGTAPVEWL